jgi:phage-related protein
MKPLRFVGASLDELRKFPAAARREAGFELDAVQRGDMPTDFKPMFGIGAGVYEIRIHIEGEWRVIYIARKREAVYVLHAFHKTSQQTRKTDIDLATSRFRQLGA